MKTFRGVLVQDTVEASASVTPWWLRMVGFPSTRRVVVSNGGVKLGYKYGGQP